MQEVFPAVNKPNKLIHDFMSTVYSDVSLLHWAWNAVFNTQRLHHKNSNEPKQGGLLF